MTAAIGSICCFCQSAQLHRRYSGVYHPVRTEHGPFDLYVCGTCGSLVTDPLPSSESLQRLYAHFTQGISPELRRLREDDDQTKWFLYLIRRIERVHGKKLENITWIEAGAGAGEMSSLFAARHPGSRGFLFDLHERPEALSKYETQLRWQLLDFSNPEFSEQIKEKADLVWATGVWEHVLHPDIFARNLIRLLNPGGFLYLVTPNYASLASRCLGKFWPLLTPGEHLNIPTPAGARACLEREVRKVGINGFLNLRSGSISLPYTLRYTFSVIGFPRIGGLFGRLALPLPVGALEACLQLDR